MKQSKTVGIVTYHKSLSYGGCLQALATQLVLENLGYRPVFVDYENRYEARKKTFAGVLRYGSMKERVAETAKRLAYKEGACIRRAFEAFHEALPKTERTYQSVEAMQDVDVDILLAASDQIWNPEITGGLDPAFFLQFGRYRKRVSFSSSMGSYVMPEQELVQVGAWLDAFDAVSVRENHAKKQIEPYVLMGVRVMLDPTLLLNGNQWRSLAVPMNGLAPGKYILIFMVTSSTSRFENMARLLKGAYGVPVVQVRLNLQRPSCVDRVLAATPYELVWLIDNAAFVLTDSFHGTAFSLNLETPFATLPNHRNNARLEELLEGVELSGRFVEDEEGLALSPHVDFAYARKTLQERRTADVDWLASALQ